MIYYKTTPIPRGIETDTDFEINILPCGSVYNLNVFEDKFCIVSDVNISKSDKVLWIKNNNQDIEIK
jgi:hypothetical protein